MDLFEDSSLISVNLMPVCGLEGLLNEADNIYQQPQDLKTVVFVEARRKFPIVKPSYQTGSFFLIPKAIQF